MTSTPIPGRGGPRVIGLDLSAEATGVALHDGETFTVHAPKPASKKKRIHADNMARLAHIDARISDVLARHSPDMAVIEDYAPRLQSSAAHRLAEIGGAARLACWRAGVPVALVNVMHAKIYATGKGTADKSDMRMALYQRAGIDNGDDNQVDSWWLRAMGLDALGHPVVEMPKAHRAVLSKVAWPSDLVVAW